MVLQVRESIKIVVMGAVALAALLALLGCDPTQLFPYQGQPYPGPQYQPQPQPYGPPPPGYGPQAMPPAPYRGRGPLHLQDVEARIWGLTNEIRQQYGVPPLAWEGPLTGVAQAYSDDMLVRRFFGHTNPEGLTAGDRLKPYYQGPVRGWGENIWEGSNLSPANPESLARFIMNSWMSSPGHRENILSPRYTHLGVGVAANGGDIRATQLFANLRQN